MAVLGRSWREGRVPYSSHQIETLNRALARVIEGTCDGAEGACTMIRAARQAIPFEAAFCVVYRAGHRPVYLADTYPAGAAKEAVQIYVTSTYLLNPVYNAFLGGMTPGIRRMAEFAPDNWQPVLSRSGVFSDADEEIGYRTPGWPGRLQELELTVDLPDGAMGEISFARSLDDGGVTPEMVGRLEPFYPLFAAAMRRLWSQHPENTRPAPQPDRQLGEFARDILSPREVEIVHMILKGHSSLSISLTLGIALPTVKTHRRNAYAKLGISTQQQLFGRFLAWQADGR